MAAVTQHGPHRNMGGWLTGSDLIVVATEALTDHPSMVHICRRNGSEGRCVPMASVALWLHRDMV